MRVAAVGALAIAAWFALGLTQATAHNGPQHSVKVGVLGPGTVADSLGQIACPGDCSGLYGGINDPSHAASVTLSASPSGGASFSGWSGCPSPSGASCTISLDAAQTSTDVTATFTAAPVLAGADLEVMKNAPIEVSIGRTFDYTFSIRNLGPEEARDVVLTDALPAVFSVSERASGCTVESRTLRCAIGALSSGTVTSKWVRGSFSVSAGTITNTVRLTSSTADPNTANNESTTATRAALPPAPTIEITAPAEGALFERPDLVTVSGRIQTPSGRVAFCVSVDSTTMPSPCVGVISSGTENAARFTELPVVGLRTGTHMLTAWTRDRDGRTASDSVRVTVATEETGLDVRTLAMEISQGIQEYRLSPADGVHEARGVPSPHLRDRYDGVTLVESKQTAVRLYATADSMGGLERLRGVRAVLHGFRAGTLVPLPGSPLLPMNGSRNLGVEAWPASRYRNDGAYVFLLPRDWVQGTITLIGEVNPAGLTPRIVECGRRCELDNPFAITDISFRRVRAVFVDNVDMTYFTGPLRVFAARDPLPLYDAARKLLPAPSEIVHVSPYVASLNITDRLLRLARENGFTSIAACLGDREPDEDENCRQRASLSAFRRCGRWARDDGRDRKTLCLQLGLRGFGRLGGGYGSASTDRPMLSMAHELLHMLRFPHASACGGADYDRDWPPDERGYIQGVGLDVTRGSGGTGLLRVLAPGFPDEDTQFYDLMSYCASERTAWISVNFWNELLEVLASGFGERSGEGRRQLQAVGPTVLVEASVDGDGRATIEHVGSGTRGTTASQPGAPYRLVARDPSGAIVADVAVAAEDDVSHGGSGAFLSAVLPVPSQGLASVELIGGVRVLASRRRSAHPPTVRLTAPTARARLGSRGVVAVRWAAADADGERLETEVDYSTDGGRSWRTLTVADGATASIPARLFARTRNGRVRVTVSDGFDETTAVSGSLVSAGSPPTAQIVEPSVRGLRVQGDAPLNLVGQAYDDRGSPIAGSRLRWFVGRRLVGRGVATTLTSLPAGPQMIRLVAKDAFGRVGEARLPVRVLAATPAFLNLRAPTNIARSARTLRIVTAATIPSVLVVQGRRFTVGRAARAIVLRVQPGSQPLSIPLTLTAGGRSAKLTLRVTR